MSRLQISAALLVLGLAGSAMAHPKLTAASPPVGGRVSASPKEIRLTFNDPVYANFSGLQITDPAGHAVKTLKPRVEAKAPMVLIVPVVGILTPGVYKVEWHAVSTDTHRVTGKYVFTLG